jgi:hypothetical protein
MNQKQPIKVCEPDPAARLAPQHHHLMPQCHILCRKLAVRFEWRSQDGEKQQKQRGSRTTIQGVRIFVSSPLFDGYDEPEILASSKR